MAAARQRPTCPLPVLLLIRTLAVVGGGAGLFSTIYGGLGLMKATDPALDPERGKHAALMITGLVELVIALVAGMLTQDCSGSGTTADHPPA